MSHKHILPMMMMAGALALTPVIAPAMAQTPAGKAAAKLSAQDDKFAREAAAGGMAEVALGTLATQKAPAEDIKQFGQRMVTDHTKANQRLMAIVKEKGITVPKELTGEHKVHHEQLSKAKGHDFDRMYLGHMVKAHEKTVKIFEQQAEKGTDASLRAFAQETLPTLREHLKLAQQLATAHGAHADHGAHGSTHQ